VRNASANRESTSPETEADHFYRTKLGAPDGQRLAVSRRPSIACRGLSQVDHESARNAHFDKYAGETDPLPAAIKDAGISGHDDGAGRRQDGVRIGNDLG
jgi:hypothetical protein